MRRSIEIEVDAAESARPTRYAWIAFALTYALMMSDYMSRQVMIAVFPFIKAEWALSDTQLGSLVSVVALTVGVMIIPISLVADRVGRVRSITAMAVVWGVATIACGLTGNFIALLIARAALGLGEAGYGSAGGAILLQVFPTRMHSTVLGTFLSGSLFGSVLGLAVGGVLAQNFGWQKAFMVVGAFGLVLALVFPLVVREPSARIGTSAARVPMKQVTRALLTTRTAVCVYVGLGATMFVQGAVIAWASSYFNRYLAMDPADAAKHAGLLAVCSGIGMIGGGYVVDRLSRKDKRNRLRIPALFAFCSGLILLTAFLGSPGVLQLIADGHRLDGRCVRHRLVRRRIDRRRASRHPCDGAGDIVVGDEPARLCAGPCCHRLDCRSVQSANSDEIPPAVVLGECRCVYGRCKFLRSGQTQTARMSHE